MALESLIAWQFSCFARKVALCDVAIQTALKTPKVITAVYLNKVTNGNRLCSLPNFKV